MLQRVVLSFSHLTTLSLTGRGFASTSGAFSLDTLRRLMPLLTISAGLCLSMAGCGKLPLSSQSESSVNQIEATAPVTVTAAADQTTIVATEHLAPSAPDSRTAPSDKITLTMWTTEAFSPLQDDLGSQLLRQQVAEFEAQEPNTSVQFTLKKAYGQGGMYDFLQTTHAVVPERLPDIAIIDVTDLPSLVGQGLLRPLNDLIAEELRGDLFPFAKRSCTIEGDLFGLPFETELIHVAFNAEVAKSPPLTWEQVLSSTMSYAFPISEEDSERVSRSFWLQYLALGNEKGDQLISLGLERERLAEVFGFYRQGIEIGVIPRSVLDYQSEADAWAAYLSGKVNMVDVSSLRFLSSHSLLRETGVAPAPTKDGRTFSLAKVWALVILAEERDRQEAAARFLQWLLKPEHNGAWAKATDRLPTTRQSLRAWDQPEPYFTFYNDLLEQSETSPTGPNFDLLSRRLQRSLRDVLAGTVSPAEAANQVISIAEK